MIPSLVLPSVLPLSDPRAAMMRRRGRSFDYYVDAANGSDANDGLTRAGAFASFTALNAMASLAGKKIGIAGGTYYQQLTPAGNGVEVGSYNGNVILDCRAAIPAMTKTAGQTNVWQATITLPGDTKVLGNAWENGAMLKQVTSLALCDTTAGSFYVGVVGWQAASATIYVHATGDTDPTANGLIYLYSARSHGLKLNGTGCKIRGKIKGIGNAHQDGSLVIYGGGSTVDGASADDGARHSCLFAPPCIILNCTFFRSQNVLEATSGNGVIIYAPTITGTDVMVSDCSFIQGTAGAFTGIAGHGVPATQLFANLTYARCTWDGCSAESGCNAGNAQILAPVFISCNAGFAVDVTGTVVTITGGSGSISRLFQCSVAGTVNSVGGNYTVPVLGTASSVGFYRTNSSSGDVVLNINGDKLTILDGPSANSTIVYWQRGAISIQNMEVLPALAAKINFIVDAGFGGNSISYTGANNKWPFGSKFRVTIGGVLTTYRTLAAFQAAGFEAGSVLQPFPATISADDFNRPDENLEASTNWTRVDGVAAMVAVRSSKLATLGATRTFYRRAALSSPDQWLRFTTATNNGSGSYVVLGAADKDNFLGIAWDTTTWYLAQKLAGTLTFPATTTTIVPASGQDVVLARRANTVWLYVNGDLISRVDVSAALAANVGVGVVSHDTARNPWIDDFRAGIL